MTGILKDLDSWMQDIWMKVVKKEYKQGRILEESNLHSTIYFHLRKLIESSKGNREEGVKPPLLTKRPLSKVSGPES